jgi:hypothetical protein
METLYVAARIPPFCPESAATLQDGSVSAVILAPSMSIFHSKNDPEAGDGGLEEGGDV